MAAPALCRDALTYVAFLLVGTSCGWFVVNGQSLKSLHDLFFLALRLVLFFASVAFEVGA